MNSQKGQSNAPTNPLASSTFSIPHSFTHAIGQLVTTPKTNIRPSSQSHEDFVKTFLSFLLSTNLFRLTLSSSSSPKYDKEYIPNIKVFRRENEDIDLAKLVQSLKNTGFPVDGNIVSYYSYMSDMYVYCGSDPIPAESSIPSSEVAETAGNKQVFF